MKRLLIFLLMIAISQLSYSIKPGNYGCLGGRFFENPILKGLKLLARLANANSENSNQKPIHSLNADNFQVSDNVQKFSDEESSMLLCIAVIGGHGSTEKNILDKEFREIVFKSGENRVNTVLKDGSTLLHLACSMNNINMTDFLLKYGAKHDIFDESGQLPIHVVENRILLNKLRVQFGDEIINIKDENRETLLDIIEKNILRLSNNIDQWEKEYKNFECAQTNINSSLSKIEELTEYKDYLKSIGGKYSFEIYNYNTVNTF